MTKPKNLMGTPSGAGNQMGAQQLEDVEHRARPIDADARGIDMHLERWTKVDQQNQKDMSTDQDQLPFKEIKVQKFEGDQNFQLGKTQELGVFTVTTEETKTGVATNVQGSSNGAWLEDTLERLTKVVTQMEVAKKELAT